MGITGLLPALKSIHRTRNLSEFKGQIIAVDAYVWLHKGVYSCATDLATGKPTHRYVDYCMHRVRLLRHFGIEPYIVFDGGALPAKRGTENDRKQRREENRIRGNALVAQGKHSQAREYFIKCIDVTPQMAYQLIKALRAENVQYVVAPYEADAQMAFLERIGQVDAILTEDSDLLVFGCQNVLFKLDAVANTVCHISRTDFGSVTTSATDTSSINLLGWNDTQFRAMSILSGCDYLPSINGVGLKTANNLLKKWKTAEAAVRAIMLEGKKCVPNGYLNQFKLADICFRFQRVYDPREEKLVHLTEIDEEWDEEKDIYVGECMEPEVAQKIASGDMDPTTREQMKDINPSFKPRSLKKLETIPKPPNQKSKGKAKANGEGILAFFGANPLIPREKSVAAKSAVAKATGTFSGKKTLGEIMDLDIANQKQRNLANPRQVVESKFFNQTATPQISVLVKRKEEPHAGPSRNNNKENVYIVIDDDHEEREETLSDLSLKLNISPSRGSDFDLEEPQDAVEQEDGYMSPFSVYAEETQELSSPVSTRIFTPTKKKKRRSSARHSDRFGSETDCEDYNHRGFGTKKPRQDDFDVDPISSPISTIKRRRRSISPHPRGLQITTPTRSISMGNVLVAETPMRKIDADDLNMGADEEPQLFGMQRKIAPLIYKGPDLQSCLGDMDDREDVTYDDERESIIGLESYRVPRPSPPDFSNFVKSRMGGVEANSSFESGIVSISGSGSISPLSPSPHTPADGVKQVAVVIGSMKDGRTMIDIDAEEGEEEIEMEVEELIHDDPEEMAAKLQKESVKAVAKGWRMKWALGQLNREDSTSSLSSSPSPGLVKKGKQKKKMDSEETEAKKRRQSAPNSFGIPKLRRSETNVTPLGKHSFNRQPLQQSQTKQAPNCVSTQKNVQRRSISHSTSFDNINTVGKSELQKRSSLVFFEEVRPSSVNQTKSKARKAPETIVIDDDDGDGLDVDINERARLRLAQFRCQ